MSSSPRKDDTHAGQGDGEPRWLLAEALRQQLAFILEQAQHSLPWHPWRAGRLLAEAIRLIDEDGAAAGRARR